MSKPYRPGDWVILDGGLEGRVIETNWRATQILIDTNDVAFVPNSIVAKSNLRNASQPTGFRGLKVLVRLDPAVALSSGVAVLGSTRRDDLRSSVRHAHIEAFTASFSCLDMTKLSEEQTFSFHQNGGAPRNRAHCRISETAP
jgi:hypothetical protein